MSIREINEEVRRIVQSFWNVKVIDSLKRGCGSPKNVNLKFMVH